MKRILCIVLALALVLLAVPAFASGTGLTLDKTPVGNTGAVITVSGGSGAVSASSSDADIAEVSVSGTTVTVTGAAGKTGVVTVTVTRGNLSAVIGVPIGYTTFSFSGSSVTVYPGSDSNYEIVAIEKTSETEFTGAEGTGELTVSQDADGNGVYTAASGYELSVNIKKKGGTYAFNGTGEAADIMVKKEATKDAVLLLDGLSLKSAFTAAITVKKNSAAAVYLTAVAGTVTTLADSAANNADSFGPTADGGDGSNEFYAESAVIKGKTKANIVIGGEGVININAAAKNGVKVGAEGFLTVEGSVLSVAAPNSGLSSENELLISGGTVTINSTGDAVKAADDTDMVGTVTVTGGTLAVTSGDEGILAREKVVISGGTLNITAAGDGIKAENADETAGEIDISDGTFTVSTTGDGVTGSNVVISGGEFTVTCANGHTNTSYNGDNASTPSAKCLKAEADLTITGGSFTLSSPDDTLHSDGNITIEGGSFEIWTRDDGVHANYVLSFGIRGASDDLIDLKINTCCEGIEGADIILNSGTVTIYSTDDVINAANKNLANYNYKINVYGGTYRLYTSGGDGVDSNGGAYFRGGDLEVYSTSNTSNDPLDTESTLALYDGIVLACGQNAMQGAPSAGIYVQFTGCSIKTGYSLVIKDGSGSVLKSTTAYFKSASNTANYVVFSHPDMVSGNTYYLYINGSSTPKTATAVGAHVDSTPWTDLDEGGADVYERVTSMTGGSKFVITNAAAGTTVNTLSGTTTAVSAQSTLTAVAGGYAFGTVSELNTWYTDASGHIYNTVGGTNYYLAYTASSGGWSQTYTLTKTTDAANAASWEITASGSASVIGAPVSGGQGGPGGGPGGGGPGGPGGQQRRIYLYCSGGTWKLASSTSASGYTVYIYAPAVEQAALTGTTYYTADASNGFAVSDIHAGTFIKYRSSRSAAAETLSWDDPRISASWSPDFDSSVNGVYVMTVSFNGTAFGTVTVKITGGTDPVTGILGDADGNGAVEAPDALIVLRMAMGIIAVPGDISLIDVDGNGRVEAADALLILRCAMGIITEF